MVNKIFVKKFNQTLDVELSIVRYPSSKSESGSYIFAPFEAEPLTLDLTVIEAYKYETEVHEKLLLFIKSSYFDSAFALVTIQLSKKHNRRVVKTDLSFN